MNKTVRLAIAALVAALVTTVGVAAPADAKPISPSLGSLCC
ncbi:hypothetical protein [Nocardioides antri]|nr:hypothetical protein [Nocardioides antri]